MIASLFASVSAFADEGKPGPDDLKDAGKYVYGPKNDESWLDEYKEAYVYASYGVAAYTYCTSTCAAKSKTI